MKHIATKDLNVEPAQKDSDLSALEDIMKNIATEKKFTGVVQNTKEIEKKDSLKEKKQKKK